MKETLKGSFIIHLCKYLGVALISGSVVHVGTLGGSLTKYAVFMFVGLLLMVMGNYLESVRDHERIDVRFLGLAVGLSFGTGMLSGGIQHYLDNPAYGAVLLSVGLLLTYITFAYKYFRDTMTKKGVLVIAVLSVVIYGLGAYALPTLLVSTGGHIPHSAEPHGH